MVRCKSQRMQTCEYCFVRACRVKDLRVACCVSTDLLTLRTVKMKHCNSTLIVCMQDCSEIVYKTDVLTAILYCVVCPILMARLDRYRIEYVL